MDDTLQVHFHVLMNDIRSIDHAFVDNIIFYPIFSAITSVIALAIISPQQSGNNFPLNLKTSSHSNSDLGWGLTSQLLWFPANLSILSRRDSQLYFPMNEKSVSCRSSEWLIY